MDYQRIAPMMTNLWSPIAAVSSSWEGTDNAQIAVAIAGASIVPARPRVIVQIYKTNFTHELVLKKKAFALNFLRRDQLELMHQLGFTSGRQKDKLTGVRYHAGMTGSPIFEDCFGYLDCQVINAMDGGDMTCFLAEVVDGESYGGEPLWWSYARSAMPKEWNEEWEKKIQREIRTSLKRMDKIERAGWQP